MSASGTPAAGQEERSRGGDDPERTLADSLPYHEPGYEFADTRASLDRLLATLSRRDRELLRLRYEEDLTQRELGQRIGLSQMHVSRLLRGIVAELSETAARGGTRWMREPPERGTERRGRLTGWSRRAGPLALREQLPT